MLDKGFKLRYNSYMIMMMFVVDTCIYLVVSLNSNSFMMS